MKSSEHKENKVNTHPTLALPENMQKFFPGPRVVDGSNEPISKPQAVHLAAIMQTIPNLTSVNLNSSALTPATLELISAGISPQSTITAIDIGDNPHVFDTTSSWRISTLVEAIDKQNALTSINLCGMQLPSHILRLLAPALSSKPIKYLNLSKNDLGYGNGIVLALKAINPQSLVHLNLSLIRSNDTFLLKNLAEIFNKLSVIETLELSSNDFNSRYSDKSSNEANFTDFIFSVAKSKTLKHLGLSGTNLSFYQFTQMLQSLKYHDNKTLCSIDLGYNGNLWAGLILRQPTAAKDLELDGIALKQLRHNPNSPEFLQLKQILVEGLKWQNPSLTNLNLSHTCYDLSDLDKEIVFGALSEGLQGDRIETLSLANIGLPEPSLRALMKVFSSGSLKLLDLSASYKEATAVAFLRLAQEINPKASLKLFEDESLLLKQLYETAGIKGIKMQSEVVTIIDKTLSVISEELISIIMEYHGSYLNTYLDTHKMVISGFSKAAAALSVLAVDQKSPLPDSKTEEKEPASVVHKKVSADASSSAPIPSLLPSDDVDNADQIELAGNIEEL